MNIMPCKKLKLTNNTFYFFAVSRKGLRDMLLHTPSKRLSGPLTGSVIGLFVLCQACHSDKDPLWRHSCGDSLWSNCLAEKLTEKWRPWEACVCIFTACVCERRQKGMHLQSFAPQHVCVHACLLTFSCLP